MRLAIVLWVVLVGGVAHAQPREAPFPPLEHSDDEVSEIQQIVGPPTAAMLGFGLGHVVEGRWHEKGWIFTLGETLGVAALVYASVNIECTSGCALVGPAFVTGLLGVEALRIWEVYDSVEGARAHNRRVLQMHLQLAPVRGSGGTAGLALQF